MRPGDNGQLRLLRPPVQDRIEIAPAPVRATDDPDDVNYDPESVQMLRDGINEGAGGLGACSYILGLVMVSLAGLVAYLFWKFWPWA